jgi:hypothetical protein
MIFKFLHRRNNFSLKIILVFFMVLSLISPDVKAQLVAFPGAEGYGRLTTGGRGGAVYEVTNLNDSGAGSLRDAIGKTGTRTIVFRVSGTIALKSYLKISQGNVTIAGQTAPGDGICLSNYTLSVQANNVIVRFIRSRLGDTTIVRNSSGTPLLNSKGLPLHVEDDAAHGMGTYRNIIIDHCSFSWSIDEAASFYDNIDFTMQWCLVSESLYNSYHVKGEHGYGGIWGGQGATFHHNLLAHHTSRNPRFNGSRYSKQPDLEIVDYRNNVIYNWGDNSAYGGEGGNQNMVNNYYKPGPATIGSKRYRILDLTQFYYAPSERPDTVHAGKFYIDGNFVEGNSNASNDNWTYGVQNATTAQKNKSRVFTPFPTSVISTQTATDAYISVLNYVGACIPKRDAIDTRIFNEVLNGTVTYGDKSYPKSHNGLDTTKIYGIIDSQETVGGWPVLNSLPAPLDSDHDGMPDEWEVSHSLNPNDASDRNNIDASGYTMLEVYLNSLVSNVVVTSVKDSHSTIPSDFKLMQNYPNPFNPETTIQYMIPSSGQVDIKIYDINGRLINELYNGFSAAGIHKINWKGINQSGSKVASGNYFCVVRFNQLSKSLKLVLLK